MVRLLHFSILSVLLAASISCLRAQESSPSPALVPDEIHAMRQLIEQQTLKIEALSQQVTKLNQQLEATHAVTPMPSGTSTPATPRVEPQTKPAAEPPKAEAVATPSGLSHAVARGETLTSIAKHYKTSVADLLKANKIEDDRKLQIGQVLIIPTPPQKDAEPAPTRKETE